MGYWPADEEAAISLRGGLKAGRENRTFIRGPDSRPPSVDMNLLLCLPALLALIGASSASSAEANKVPTEQRKGRDGWGPATWETRNGVSSFGWDARDVSRPVRCPRCPQPDEYRGNGYDNLSPEWERRQQEQRGKDWQQGSGYNGEKRVWSGTIRPIEDQPGAVVTNWMGGPTRWRAETWEGGSPGTHYHSSAGYAGSYGYSEVGSSSAYGDSGYKQPGYYDGSRGETGYINRYEQRQDPYDNWGTKNYATGWDYYEQRPGATHGGGYTYQPPYNRPVDHQGREPSYGGGGSYGYNRIPGGGDYNRPSGSDGWSHSQGWETYGRTPGEYEGGYRRPTTGVTRPSVAGYGGGQQQNWYEFGRPGPDYDRPVGPTRPTDYGRPSPPSRPPVDYGRPSPGYDRPSPDYGRPPVSRPSPGYGQPAPDYNRPSTEYGREPPSYGRPPTDYGRPSPDYERPAPPAYPSRPQAPDYGRPPADYGRPPLDYGRPSSPSYGRPPTDYGRPSPDYGSSRPDYGRPSPDYGRPSPDYGRPLPPSPDYGRPSNPSYGRPPPDYGRPSPDYSRPGPDYGRPGPNYGLEGRPAEPDYGRPSQPAYPPSGCATCRPDPDHPGPGSTSRPGTGGYGGSSSGHSGHSGNDHSYGGGSSHSDGTRRDEQGKPLDRYPGHTGVGAPFEFDSDRKEGSYFYERPTTTARPTTTTSSYSSSSQSSNS